MSSFMQSNNNDPHQQQLFQQQMFQQMFQGIQQPSYSPQSSSSIPPSASQTPTMKVSNIANLRSAEFQLCDKALLLMGDTVREL